MFICLDKIKIYRQNVMDRWTDGQPAANRGLHCDALDAV